MLRRLQQSETRYKNDQFEKDFIKNQKFVKKLCNLPVSDPCIKKYTSDDFLNRKKSPKYNTFYNSPLKDKNGTFYSNNSYKKINNNFNNTTSNMKFGNTNSNFGNSSNNFSNFNSKHNNSHYTSQNKTSKNFFNHKTEKTENNTNLSNFQNMTGMTITSRTNNFMSNNGHSQKVTENNFFSKDPSKEKDNKDTISVEKSNNNLNNTNNTMYGNKIVYSRKAYIEKLGLTQVIFIIDDVKFFITVDPSNVSFEYIYTIVFDEEEEIDRLLRRFTNYEQIINFIIFDGISINFSNKIKNYLNYVSYFILIKSFT